MISETNGAHWRKWYKLNSHENPNVWRYGSIGPNLALRSLIRIPMPDSVAPFPMASQVLRTSPLGDVAVAEELCLLVGRTLSLPASFPRWLASVPWNSQKELAKQRGRGQFCGRGYRTDTGGVNLGPNGVQKWSPIFHDKSNLAK